MTIEIGHTRPSMCTRSGIEFFPLDPDPKAVKVSDISWALGMMCRYNGHCDTFYSVAEHSVLTMQYCELRWPDRKDLAKAALFHDASEAYLPDVCSPLKHDHRFGKWFNPIEEGVQKAIAEALELPELEPPEVKRADIEVFKLERGILMPENSSSWWEIKEPDQWAKQLELIGWVPPVATLRFEQHARRLFRE